MPFYQYWNEIEVNLAGHVCFRDQNLIGRRTRALVGKSFGTRESEIRKLFYRIGRQLLREKEVDGIKAGECLPPEVPEQSQRKRRLTCVVRLLRVTQTMLFHWIRRPGIPFSPSLLAG